MSIDWRRTLKKDGSANGWECGGIKEFVTKKILPVKGGRHQDLSISKKQPPCHDFGWSRGQVFISLAMHGAKVGNFLSSYIYFLQYQMSVICCHWIWLGEKTRKTTQKWFPKMSFSFKSPQQDHPALWYHSNLSRKFQSSYFLYILNRSVSGISLWHRKLIII